MDDESQQGDDDENDRYEKATVNLEKKYGMDEDLLHVIQEQHNEIEDLRIDQYKQGENLEGLWNAHNLKDKEISGVPRSKGTTYMNTYYGNLILPDPLTWRALNVYMLMGNLRGS